MNFVSSAAILQTLATVKHHVKHEAQSCHATVKCQGVQCVCNSVMLLMVSCRSWCYVMIQSSARVCSVYATVSCSSWCHVGHGVMSWYNQVPGCAVCLQQCHVPHGVMSWYNQVPVCAATVYAVASLSSWLIMCVMVSCHGVMSWCHACHNDMCITMSFMCFTVFFVLCNSVIYVSGIVMSEMLIFTIPTSRCFKSDCNRSFMNA